LGWKFVYPPFAAAISRVCKTDKWAAKDGAPTVSVGISEAGLLLYSMQLALTNVGRTTFGQAKDEEMVRETVDEETALNEKAVSNQPSAFSQDQTFETQRNGGSGGGEGLPRVNADGRGLENPGNPIEWKPTADMYRMDTREGMEAYEANFGSKIKPRVADEPRPLQGLAESGAAVRL